MDHGIKRAMTLGALSLAPFTAVAAENLNNPISRSVAAGNFVAGLSLIAVVLALVGLAIAVWLLVLWLRMLIDAIKQKNTVWIVVLIVSLPIQLWWLTSLIYYYASYTERRK